jgi:hypothetical protein
VTRYFYKHESYHSAGCVACREIGTEAINLPKMQSKGHASVATVGPGQEAGECPGGCLRERAKLTQTLELSTEAFTSWRARDHAVDLCNRTSSPRPFHLCSNFPGEYCNRQRIRPPKTIPMCESRHLGTRPRKWQHTARTPDLKPTIKGSN